MQGRMRYFIQALTLVGALSAILPAAAVQADTAKPVASAAVVQKVNINTASADALAEGLIGVGPSKAAAIVAYRTQFGAFKSVDELLEVKGIGPALLKQNQGRIVLQ
jgi:competence protein ComEA